MSKGRRRRADEFGKPKRKPKRKPRMQGVRTVKETVDIVSYVTGEPRGRVNQFARKLIDDGLLPKSIGRNVKRVGPRAAVILIFAIAHATRTADVTSTAKNFMKLRLIFTGMSREPDAKDKFDVDRCEILDDFKVSYKQQLIEVLAIMLDQDNQDDPWVPVLDISLDAAVLPSVELTFYYTEEETPGENRRLPLYFSDHIGRSGTVRTYRVFQPALEKLNILMKTPDLPEDPGDFDDFLRAYRGDLEEDQAMPEINAEEIREAHDMIDQGEGGDG